MISVSELLNGHCSYNSLSDELRKNLDELLYKINIVRFFYDHPMVINSGFRPPAYNKKIGGNTNSHHCFCRAVDVSDKNHELYNWLTTSTKGKEIAKKLDLYFEHSDDTPSWCHIQTCPPKSGRRIFRK